MSTDSERHRHHRHKRPLSERINRAWQDVPVRRRRFIFKIFVGVIATLLAIALGALVVFISP